MPQQFGRQQDRVLSIPISEKRSHYIVQTATAKMPSSCKGRYRRVAVLEVEPQVTRASMISERAKGVIRVVEIWDRLNVGKTEKCAYQRALTEARALADRLNGDAS